MINRFSQREIFQLHIGACFAAAREGFPHLAVQDIVNPPHTWFDAALARQVVFHIMIHELKWPKRRMVEEVSGTRDLMIRATKVVNRRLQSPRFATHYRTIAARARELIHLQLHDLAEEVA